MALGRVFGANEAGAFADHCDSLELDRLKAQRERELLADAEYKAACGGRRELVVGARDDIVDAQGEQRPHESPRQGGAHAGDQGRGAVDDLDRGVRHGGAGDVQDHAPDDAG